jgi:uncharacterized protein YbjT (DUF2867 family)
LPLIPVPVGFVVQPVDSGEVAARLAELALGEPRGRVPDMAGPQVLSFADVIRIYLQATGRWYRSGRWASARSGRELYTRDRAPRSPLAAGHGRTS